MTNAPVSPAWSRVDATPWLNVGLRALLALFGAYGVALLATAVLAVTLPLSRIEASMAAIMAGFLIQMLCVVWVIATASVARAVIGLAVPAALLAALLCVLPNGGAA